LNRQGTLAQVSPQGLNEVCHAEGANGDRRTRAVQAKDQLQDWRCAGFDTELKAGMEAQMIRKAAEEASATAQTDQEQAKAELLSQFAAAKGEFARNVSLKAALEEYYPDPALEERRPAPDGNMYTMQEFHRFFGGTTEWDAASAYKNSVQHY